MKINSNVDVEITADVGAQFDRVLTPEALSFLVKLHNHFDDRRRELLVKREQRQKELDQGGKPNFLPGTEHVRSDPSWRVAPTPSNLQKRWVEITGPTDRKMVINALNSGANVFMADFEDACSPTWDNILNGQLNLIDAVNETISFRNPEGKEYCLNEEHAVLFVRPRGWHLPEKHFHVNSREISGSLFDFGLYFFHNAKNLLNKGSGPYFYLPKLESHLEARLWNDVFVFAQKELGIPVGSIRCTVLIETILAAFEMEEILFELREHSAGLNAGRWDYIFSVIKKFRHHEDVCLPDRDQVTMTVPFMRAYTELLVKTCHRRGAHAIGGMAAFIPNRRDPEVTEKALKKVRDDKNLELRAGYDGAWVAHPDLVSTVAEEMESFMQDKDNQKSIQRDDVHITSNDLLNFKIDNGTVTEEGIRHNIDVSLQYLASWLQGSGAVAIYNLMEDTATAEISRAQLWQWLNQSIMTVEGKKVAKAWLEQLINEEFDKLQTLYGENFPSKYFSEAKNLLKKLIFTDHFYDFLTLEAYEKF